MWERGVLQLDLHLPFSVFRNYKTSIFPVVNRTINRGSFTPSTLITVPVCIDLLGRLFMFPIVSL